MNKIVNAVAAAIVAFVAVTWAAQPGPQAPGSDQSVGLRSESSRFSADLDAITIPRMLNYQGTLRDSTGRVVPDTTYSVRFGLYEQPSGGGPFWWETQTVRTRTGTFSVLLGSGHWISRVPDYGTLYLGMTVEDDSEMTPRARIVSAAYAFKADTANQAYWADSAVYADTATWAWFSDTAKYARKADSAKHAAKADTAAYADTAEYARRAPRGLAAEATANDIVGTESADWVDMPDMELTVDTDICKLQITFIAGCFGGGTDSLAGVELQLLLDDEPIGTGVGYSGTAGAILRMPEVSAGPHTARVQWRALEDYGCSLKTRTLTVIEY